MDVNLNLILGDGIFDQLNNEEVASGVWLTTKEKDPNRTIHSQCGIGVDMIIKSALARRTLDNVTCVIVAFGNFDKVLFSKETKSGASSSVLSPKKYKSIDTTKTAEFESNSLSTLSALSSNVKVNKSEDFFYSKIENRKIQSSHTKYESYHLGNNEKNELKSIDNPVIKKKNVQKKLVSLDISKKANLTYNILAKADRDPIKKKLDSSEQIDKKITSVDYSTQQPSTAKSLWKTKENVLVNPIRKFPSYKGLEDIN